MAFTWRTAMVTVLVLSICNAGTPCSVTVESASRPLELSVETIQSLGAALKLKFGLGPMTASWPSGAGWLAENEVLQAVIPNIASAKIKAPGAAYLRFIVAG